MTSRQARWRRSAGAVVALAATAALWSCGESNDDSPAPAASPPPSVPARLLGTYTMSLKPADIPPSPPPELTDHAKNWTLKIIRTGGPSGGPALVIINDELGSLEQPDLKVEGDHLLQGHEECASTSGPAPYTYVSSEYSWSLEGQDLRISPIEVGCPDHVASTLLTAETWKKR